MHTVWRQDIFVYTRTQDTLTTNDCIVFSVVVAKHNFKCRMWEYNKMAWMGWPHCHCRCNGSSPKWKEMLVKTIFYVEKTGRGLKEMLEIAEALQTRSFRDRYSTETQELNRFESQFMAVVFFFCWSKELVYRFLVIRRLDIMSACLWSWWY